MRRADHQGGLDPVGGRAAGTCVRGYVVAVHPPTDGPPTPDRYQGWTVDVHVIEPGWRGLLRWVPVATQSGGVRSVEHWQPTAATQRVTGGPLTLEGGPTATPPDAADGDLVIVAFLGGDRLRPLVIGQLAHPAAPPAPTGYRWWRRIEGATFGVSSGGGVVDLYLPKTGKLVITDGSRATITISEGVVHVIGARVVAQTDDVSLNVQRVVLEAFMLDVVAILVELLPLLTLLGGLFGIALPQTLAIVPLLQAAKLSQQGRPYLATSVESD